MSGIFDLTKVANAINNFRPAFVFIVDTNVLVKTPAPIVWKIEGNSALFIISDTTILELEYIKRKTQTSLKPDDQKTYAKAKDLDHNLTNLTKKGRIVDGIQIPGGCVITVASPTQNVLQQELDKIDEIVKAFGRSDAKMLLLTKECNQLFGPDLVMLITGEFGLNNIVHSRGIPCHLQEQFPISGLKVPERSGTTIDPDKVLFDISEHY